MPDKAWLLARYAEIEAIKAEIEGMKAHNLTQPGVFEKAHFDEKAEALYEVGHSIMENR